MAFSYVSPRLCQLLDIDGQALLADASLAFASVHPDDVEGLTQANEQARRSRRPFHWEGRFLVRGEARWIRISSEPRPLPDGGSLWNGVVSDITEYKQAELHLQRANADLAATLQAIPDLLFELSESGVYLNVWARDADQLAAQKEQLLGRSVHEMLPAEAAETVMAALREAAASGYSNGQTIRLELPHGTSWFELSTAAKNIPHAAARNFIVLSRDVTRRKEAESKLCLHNAAIQTTHDGFWVVDGQGYLTEVNQAYADMSGYAREELLGAHISLLEAREQTAEEVGRHIARIMAQGWDVFETRHRRKDGSEIEIEVSTTYIADSRQFVAFLRDITERKQARDALLASQRRLETVLDTASDGIHVLDEDGNVMLCSQSFARMLGYTAAEAARLNVADWDAMIPRDALLGTLRALLDKPATFETRHRRKDGTSYDAEINTSSIELDGRRYLYASTRDITERKRTELELQEKSLRLDEAQRIAKVGSWELDLLENRLIWSDEIFRIFEIDPARFGASYEAFLDAIHPDDREAVNTAYSRSLRTREPYSIAHRLRMPDGRIKHVQEHCETEFDATGKPLRSRGTVQDITELALAEEKILLYAKLFEHTGEAMMVTDRDNRIVDINAAFTRMTGYTLEEVLGQSPNLLGSGKTPPETFQNLWASLAETGYWQGELWDRRKDGSIYPKWVAISSIQDAQGAVTHYIASFSDISERKAAEERMDRLARHDPLTGLFNRFSLQERLEQALTTAKRDQHQIALLFIDMDRFKLINDTLGHHVGDGLLIEVARRLQSCVRESDILARLGGDEFVAVLTGIDTAAEGAMVVANKILARLGNAYQIEGHELHSSPSIGISLYPADGLNATALMKAADTAMYHAKEHGRNNAQFFKAEMNTLASERLHMDRELRIALERRQFEVHYQPQICTVDGRPCGVEALVRWRHPEKGMIPPGTFIPFAEEIGLIEALGAWVLDEACRQLAAWKAADIPLARVAVNLSARQLHSAHLVRQVRDALARHGIQAGELELEITESAAMSDPEQAIAQLHALRKLGVVLSIDDFGTGYSSLAYLKRLPIQTLKLDRSFVSDIDTDPNDAAISLATIALAHNLGFGVVAEGVENEAQRDFLTAHGCEILQGYLFSKPLPAGEVGAFIHAGARA